MPSPRASRESPTSTPAAVHDWVRASPYRTGLALSAFLALFVASTSASLLTVPSVFLGSLPVTVLLAFVHEVALRRLRDDDGRDGRVRRDRDDASSVSVPGDATPAEVDAALARLRERYAAGDVDDEEFERTVDRLLATESPASARRDRTRRRRDAGAGGDRDGNGNGTGPPTGPTTTGAGRDGAVETDGERR